MYRGRGFDAWAPGEENPADILTNCDRSETGSIETTGWYDQRCEDDVSRMMGPENWIGWAFFTDASRTQQSKGAC